MALEAFLLIAASIPLLYLGARWLVESAAEVGRRAGVSPLLIGLTVVAFGTSTPELIVSTLAAASRQADVAVGNVLGSNIFNIGVVFAAGALISPLVIRAQQLGPHGAALLFSALMFLAVAADGAITALDGALLLLAIAVILAYSYRSGTTAEMEGALPAKDTKFPLKELPWGVLLAGIAVGLALLMIGAQALVGGAVDLASAAGASTRVVALTVVAAGTSLPELATTVVASAMKEHDIAVGNVVGSNVFNLLAILGASALIYPLPVGSPSFADFTVMVAFTGAMLLVARTGGRVTRLEGAVLLAAYLGYLAWLIAG